MLRFLMGIARSRFIAIRTSLISLTVSPTADSLDLVLWHQDDVRAVDSGAQHFSQTSQQDRATVWTVTLFFFGHGGAAPTWGRYETRCSIRGDSDQVKGGYGSNWVNVNVESVDPYWQHIVLPSLPLRQTLDLNTEVPADYAQGMHAGMRGGSPVRADGDGLAREGWPDTSFRVGISTEDGGLRMSDGTLSSLVAGMMSSASPSRVVVDEFVDSATLVTMLKPIKIRNSYEYQAIPVSGPASNNNEWDIELKALKWLPLSFKLAPGTRSGDSRFGSKA
ncbi:hypothetical protein ARMGADRAFT_1039873 [Armillaria gallica]|uniref:Uncharacterized protein n=1 Tax=Armillaria gallica TaxID=47427 RepID=A0A2H3CNC3_ARMGA|nr:hypothetical protein ARMGADRAFT_1039873 [Armillaria gallica]